MEEQFNPNNWEQDKRFGAGEAVELLIDGEILWANGLFYKLESCKLFRFTDGDEDDEENGWVTDHSRFDHIIQLSWHSIKPKVVRKQLTPFNAICAMLDGKSIYHYKTGEVHWSWERGPVSFESGLNCEIQASIDDGPYYLEPYIESKPAPIPEPPSKLSRDEAILAMVNGDTVFDEWGREYRFDENQFECSTATGGFVWSGNFELPTQFFTKKPEK